MDRELQEAVSIRSLRESSHGLAVKARYRNYIDIHHASLIATAVPVARCPI
jgi:hypothetical protein